MAACWVKPFQLTDRESLKNEFKEAAERRQVMLEDRLQDVHKLQNEDTLEDKDKDVVFAKYLKVVNSVSFYDL